MKRVKCFFVRHQAEGILTNAVFAKPPTTAEAREALDALRVDQRHKLVHPKTGEPYWVKIVESVLMVPDEIAHAFEPAPEPEALPEEGEGEGEGGEPGRAMAAMASPQLSGTGIVTNPADQTPEQAKAAAETRARRAAERGRETMTLTSEDVAEIDPSDFDK